MKTLPVLLLLAALSLQAEKKTVVPPEFTGSTSPFSPGILVDGTLYVSGQMGRDLKTNRIPAEFEQEIKTCLDRIGLILKAGGMKFDDVVSVQIYLSDMSLFARMNAVYTGYFKAPLPTRSTVGVSKLADPAGHIEITVTARK